MKFFVFLLLILKHVFAGTSGKSYYSVLGISPKADETEIKKAYRKLAMKVTHATLASIYIYANT